MWRVVIFFWKAVDRFFRFQWRFLGSEATRVIFCWKAADRCQSRVKVNRLLCSLAWAASRVEKWMLSTEEQYIYVCSVQIFTHFSNCYIMFSWHCYTLFCSNCSQGQHTFVFPRVDTASFPDRDPGLGKEWYRTQIKAVVSSTRNLCQISF